MNRRSILKHLLVGVPVSLLFPWRKLGATTEYRPGLAPIRKVNKPKLSKVQLINAALGGEVEGDYRGFPYSWTGYKPSIDNIVIAGQWVTYSFTNRKPPFLHQQGKISPFAKVGEPVFIFSSTPGASGQYGKGATFNIGKQPWQDTPTLESSIESLIAEMEKALEVLKFEIDAYLDGPHKEVFNYRNVCKAGDANKPVLIESDISVNQWIRKLTT